MKKINIGYLFILIALSLSSCNDWLDRDSKTFVDGNSAYSNIDNVIAILADFYVRLPDTGAIYQTANEGKALTGMFTELDEAMSGIGQNDVKGYGYNYWSLYDYVLVRDINTYLANIKDVTFMTADNKAYFVAEARFLRAYVYFEMVKRMGGVPLITEAMSYEPGMDISAFQVARSKEYEIYDFIASEIDEIQDDLARSTAVQYNRASKGAALALKSRAMLYAASLAKYNSSMNEPVTLMGQEVGIPASMATKYYQASLKAAQDLMKLNIYGLYNTDSDKKANFYKAFTTLPSEGNKEAIFIKEFIPLVVTHKWTSWNVPRSLSDGGTNGNVINPSLNLVDAFEYLDGTDGKLKAYVDPNHEDEIATTTNRFDNDPDAYIYYNGAGDIFANKDSRLFGSIMTPGSSFKTAALDIRAGIAYYNESTGKFTFYEQGNRLDNPNELIINNVLIAAERTGYDGPSEADYVTRTGFYVKKYMDENVGPDGESGLAYMRFRYGEVLLNAAEAAFELGGAENEELALGYVNQLRDRAGFAEKLKSLTLDRIRNERRVELAFEGHRYYDLRRWRIAEEVWDGNNQTKSAMLYGLWPYKVYRPGHSTHNKWIFVRRLPAKFQTPRKFVRANYYASFPDNALTSNPKLIKNPGH